MSKAVPKKRAKPPRRPPDQVRGIELANSKTKIRNQKEEIDKLTRSNKLKDDLITRLNMANKYLSKTT
jgi:hypothetical protein